MVVVVDVVAFLVGVVIALVVVVVVVVVGDFVDVIVVMDDDFNFDSRNGRQGRGFESLVLSSAASAWSSLPSSKSSAIRSRLKETGVSQGVGS